MIPNIAIVLERTVELQQRVCDILEDEQKGVDISL